ncbi:MAG: SDR family oxidoreductase [Pirellula sp.]|nr:SDR family oxidoreductase [Pirellula sp.]
MRILVTGANGQLGRLVIHELAKINGIEVVAGVRRPESASVTAGNRTLICKVDYDDPASLVSSMTGVDRVLLISSSEVGQRSQQHQNVIEAARTTQVKMIAYTSILHAPMNPMLLAREHQNTEQILYRSGLPFVLLRNGWYTENYLAGLPQVLKMGQLFGCADNGKLSLASRSDYAAAAAMAIAGPEQHGKVYELAGDKAYTMNDIAGEISRQSGRHIPFVNLTESDYCSALQSAGLPEGFAKAIADSDAHAANGALHDDTLQLSRLIGRPTTTLQDAVRSALQDLARRQ